MDTEKQRQRRRDGTRLSESRNTRSKLLGELLSGPECRRPVWFLDMKYQTCFTICQLCHAHVRKDTRLSPLSVLQATKAGRGLGKRLPIVLVHDKELYTYSSGCCAKCIDPCSVSHGITICYSVKLLDFHIVVNVHCCYGEFSVGKL